MAPTDELLREGQLINAYYHRESRPFACYAICVVVPGGEVIEFYGPLPA